MIISAETSPQPQRRISDGYRQGIITAITVFLGFSFSFLHYWVFEAPGKWTVRSVLVAAALTITVLLEICALFRALRLADDNEREYGKTVIWFIGSAGMLLLGLLLAAIAL
jgi:hypothetical protein